MTPAKPNVAAASRAPTAKMMRALVATPGVAGSVRVAEVPRPSRRRNGEALIRVIEVGVCGTDREIYRGDVGEAPAGSDKLIIGHEMLGVVERAAGELVVGDFVTASVRRPCRSCLNCRTGKSDSCSSGAFIERGIKGGHGFGSEYVVEHPEYLYRVPRGLERLGVLAEPLSVCERGIRHSLTVGQRQGWTPKRAVVVGVGAIGMLSVLLLRLAGIETRAISQSPDHSKKADLVRAVGASYESTSVFPLDRLLHAFGGADLVVEATGSAEAMVSCIQGARPNGVICLLGVDPSETEVSIPANALSDLVVGNRAVIGSVNASHKDWVASIADLTRIKQRWPDVVRDLIGLRVDVADYEKAFEFKGIKAVVRFS
jgi:threonine dehydrogenase-like Zn-dependent dehydrogenase